jgi:hypothetical protein
VRRAVEVPRGEQPGVRESGREHVDGDAASTSDSTGSSPDSTTREPDSTGPTPDWTSSNRVDPTSARQPPKAAMQAAVPVPRVTAAAHLAPIIPDNECSSGRMAGQRMSALLGAAATADRARNRSIDGGPGFTRCFTQCFTRGSTKEATCRAGAWRPPCRLALPQLHLGRRRRAGGNVQPGWVSVAQRGAGAAAMPRGATRHETANRTSSARFLYVADSAEHPCVQPLLRIGRAACAAQTFSVIAVRKHKRRTPNE